MSLNRHILLYGPNLHIFTLRTNFLSKAERVSITNEFCIFELVYVTNVIWNRQNLKSNNVPVVSFLLGWCCNSVILYAQLFQICLSKSAFAFSFWWSHFCRKVVCAVRNKRWVNFCHTDCRVIGQKFWWFCVRFLLIYHKRKSVFPTFWSDYVCPNKSLLFYKCKFVK